MSVAIIGFGEAGEAFAGADGWQGRARAYDRLVLDEATRAGKLRDCGRAGVIACYSAADALAEAPLALCLVTADQALPAAREGAGAIAPGALWCDFNSVSPQTKQEAAAVIERAGGRYVDVAVMAPVHPRRLATPLMLAGRAAGEAAARLAELGFANVSIAGERVGEASAIKMIRSVMIKGIEALTAECMLAAEAAGVREAVLASLDESAPADRWAERAEYNLERMASHGLRRAAEMEEVVRTLDGLGTGSEMSRATVRRQREIGEMRLGPDNDLETMLGEMLDRLGERRQASAA